jgi:hypothetical protein
VLERPLLSISGKAVEEAAIRQFGAGLLGELILPGSERYEQARRHWSGLTDPRHPGLIIRCAATPM